MRSRILPNWESGMDLQGARRERFWGQGSKPKSSFFYKKRAFLTKREYGLPRQYQFGYLGNSKNYTSIVKNLKTSKKIHTRGEIKNLETTEAI
jgi:hypothetical protein